MGIASHIILAPYQQPFVTQEPQPGPGCGHSDVAKRVSPTSHVATRLGALGG